MRDRQAQPQQRRRRPAPPRPSTVPPCRSATWRTIASPRPEPGRPRAAVGAVEAVEHVRQVVGRRCPARGRARSARRRAVAPRPRCRAGSTWPRCRAGSRPRGRAARGSPATSDGSSSASNTHLGRMPLRALDRRRRRARRAARPPTARTSRLARRARARRGRRPARSAPRAGRRGRARRRSRSARRRARRRRASTSMFVRSDVSGVRSSCDASATSWRCARCDALERLEHRVEEPREPGELVVALGLDAPREVARAGDVLGGSVSSATGRDRGRVARRPRNTASADAGEREEPERRCAASQSALSTSVSGRATWTTAPSGPRVV